jgi:hypothetical protein
MQSKYSCLFCPHEPATGQVPKPFLIQFTLLQSFSLKHVSEGQKHSSTCFPVSPWTPSFVEESTPLISKHAIRQGSESLFSAFRPPNQFI